MQIICYDIDENKIIEFHSRVDIIGAYICRKRVYLAGVYSKLCDNLKQYCVFCPDWV
jgi:hypothetical protein